MERRQLGDRRRAVRVRAALRARRARPGRWAHPAAACPVELDRRCPRTTSVSAGSRPRNENRPHRSACSTDSSRKPGGSSSAGAHELHERRDRRLEVGEHLAPHRHDGVVAGERDELVARRTDRGVHGSDGSGRGAAAEGAEEAAALAGVARAPPLLLDDEQQRVDVAVVARLAHPLAVARGLALAPDSGGCGSRTTCARSSRVRRSASSFIHAEHQHLAVPCSCTIAATRPSASYVTVASSSSVAAIGVATGVAHRPTERSRRDLRDGSASHADSAVLAENPAVTRPNPAASLHRPSRPRRPTRAAAPRRRARRSAGTGCASGTTPRCSRTSKPRTPTPAACARPPRTAARARSSTRSWRRVQETDASAPVRRGRVRVLHAAPSRGSQYDVHCRRPAAHAGPSRSRSPRRAPTPGEAGRARRERARRRPRLLRASATSSVSPDQRSLAYTIDITGGERYELRFRDLADRRRPRRRRPRRVLRRGVGERRAHGALHPARRRHAAVAGVAPHARHAAGRRRARATRRTTTASTCRVDRTRSGRFLVITSASKVTTEVWLVDADDPLDAADRRRAARAGSRVPRRAPPRPGRRPALRPHERATAPRTSRSMVTPVATPGRAHWTDGPRPPRPTCASTTSTRSPSALVVSERADALERLRVLDARRDGAIGDDHVVAMPDERVLGVARQQPRVRRRRRCATGTRRWSRRRSAFDYDAATARLDAREAQPVPGYDPARYETPATVGDRRRRHAGARSRSCTARRPAPRRRASPLLLYGYGSYEVSIDPTFSAARVSLLDRGVVFAIAHVRGGGELGRRWYERRQALAQDQHVHRLRRVRRAPRRRGLHVARTGSSRAAAAPAGC